MYNQSIFYHSNGFSPSNSAVLPIKAALQFDNIDGFGEWRLLMSTRATQDLRNARRTNRGLFKIIVKKMKELSHGQFTESNQQRLNKPGGSVPIYLARLTSDLRLVYRIDCIPECDSDVEHQALRIFGLYTHAQINRPFWDSVGNQLARKDKEYRKRCDFRNQSSDDAIKPASFPAPELVDAEPELSVLDLPCEDMDELQTLILEKFFAFSRAFLNSLIADQDTTQVFTVTPQEQEIIEHKTSCYVLGRSGTGKTTTMLFKMLGIEKAWKSEASHMAKPRQLFVTQSRMLADKVEEYFSKLMESLATASKSLQELAEIAKQKQVQKEEEGLVDPDDEDNWRDDLPDRFSFLEEKHFPLFITFEKLCQLLEADFPQQRQPVLMVSYDIFRQSYWPRFPQSITKGLDPSLVFSEFMGVIKGSEQALDCADNCLDYQTYENLSHRSQSTFSGQRSQIYAVFNSYVKRKREQNQYDSADRTHWILKDMLNRGVPGKIDFLYVDEVQDNLLIDALLLRSLCRNRDGLFWAGDTAQTISAGSAFRFDDLKSFLYRVEKRNTFGSDACITSQPLFFQLAINYRSHGGIVACAHSVVELITRFWPYAIDTIAEEKGIVDGPKPTFFYGDSFKFGQFFSVTEGNKIEFGAQQCILVRNTAARDKLRAQVGDIGLIMTLYESKGLEFNDVLLYNFFEDSTVDLSQWRVVLSALDSAPDESAPAPCFNEIRHAGVCSELKFLYVAITRARKKLWIADCSEKSTPMRIFWSNKNQIVGTNSGKLIATIPNRILSTPGKVVANPNTESPHFATTSSKQEWASTGERLFKHKRYLQAMHCFEKAGMDRELKVANAYLLRETARALPLESKGVGDAFLGAAKAFITCTKMPTIPERGRRVYYRNAGDCYMKNGDIRKAARAFYDAEAFTMAAEQYRKAGMFDDVVRIIRKHRSKMESSIAHELVDVSRLYYLREHKLKQAKALFSSTKEAVEFAAEYDLDVARAGLFEDEGNFAEAGEIHLAAGRTLEAIQVFLKKHDDQGCTQRASNSILRRLWAHLSFGVSPEIAMFDKELEKLCTAAAQLNPKLLESRDSDEITMFKAIISGDSQKLQYLGRKFDQAGDKPAALLCLDHVFAASSRLEELQELAIHALAPSLEIFLIYANLLHDIAFLPDPCNKLLVQKLFAFQAVREDRFLITMGSFLHREAAPSPEVRDKISTMTRKQLVGVFKRALCERLKRIVLLEHDFFLETKSIHPCLAALVGVCNGLDCIGSHVDKAVLNPDWYNTLIRIHLQQVLILQTLHSVEPRSVQQARQRLLLEQFYGALNPCFNLLGSPSNIVLSCIPESKQALDVVKDWAKRLIFAIDSYDTSIFLTTFLRAASLSFILDKEGAVGFIYRAPCVAYANHPPSFIRAHKRYIVYDVIDALYGVKSLSLNVGVHFVSHIVQKSLPIDISVLCDFIEYLCASIVICRRSRSIFTLHDVTLPRSWLLRWSEVCKTGHSSSTKICNVFADSMLALLHCIQTEHAADYLYLPDSTIGDAVKSVSIARICRTLCLLGHNIADNVLRDKIANGITSLETDERHLSLLYCRYIKAEQWDDLVSAMQQTTNESTMDELICLCQKDQDPLIPVDGIRLVPFSTMEEIPYVLDYDPLNAPLLGSRQPKDTAPSRPTLTVIADHPLARISILQSEMKTHHTASHQATPITQSGQQNDFTNSGVGAGNAEDENDAEELQIDRLTLEEETFSHLTDTITNHDNVISPSQDEINAARTLLFAYRRMRRHRKSAGALLSADRTRIFLQYLAVSQKMYWERRDYCYLFLGPLPHVFLCLEQIRAHAHELKKKSTKRLLTAEHQELEDARAKADQARLLIQKVERLQKLLDPKAPVHQQCDLNALKTYVQEAEGLVRGSPRAAAVQEDLHLGVKGIVTEASQKNK